MNKQTVRGVEFWMLSNLAAGAATVSFLNLLVPPFVLQQTDSALRAGVVLAIVGLAAVTGPIWGRIADKHQAHRRVYLLSMAGIVISYLILALDAGVDWYSPIFGILFGISLAAQGTVGPAFIIGAGLPEKTVSKQLTTFNLAYPLGQMLGAAAVAAGQMAEWGYRELFWMSTAILAAFFLCTVFGIARPAARMKEAAKQYAEQKQETGTNKPKLSFKSIAFSSFGLFLLVVIVSSFSNNGLTSQIANVMPNVYGFTTVQTSGLVSLAGLLNLVTIIVFGKMMERVGAKRIYVIGTAMRLAGVFAMALVGMMGSGYLVAAAIAMQIAFQGSPVSRLPAPILAAELAPVRAAEANGYYYGASALGAFIGCLAVGFAADATGWNAVNWVAAIAAVVAILLLCFGLLPMAKKKSAPG